MSSEIRVNKINNRAGLGTVEYTPTGIIVSGIVTAYEFDGNFDTTPGIVVTGIGTAQSLDVDDFVDVGSNIKLGNAGVITATTFSTANVDVTTDKIVVGSGVTIEANQVATGQATFTGIVTASAFKLSDGSNVGGVESDAANNTLGGTNAGDSITSGDNNTFFGKDAGTDITDGQYNTFLGSLAGSNTNSGTYLNTFVGYNAGVNNGNGNHNVFIGANTGINNTAWDNVFIGNYSGDANTSGTRNVFIGKYSGSTNTQSSYNVAIGFESLKNFNRSDAGGQNTAVGWQSGDAITVGRYNSLLGGDSGGNMTDGEQNSCFGYAAGRSITSGSTNTCVGYGAGKDSNQTGNNNIIIGNDAESSSTSVSNEITLGDSNISLFRVPGINLTFGNSGAVIAGVVTATSFSGSGANLTSLPAANITGTLPAISGANLTNISGANITGVIPSSSLTNVDLTGIRRDIALLSLQTAVDTNRVVYNLENSLIEQFEDSTGLSATTTVSRNSNGEFIYAGTSAAQSAISYSYDGSDDTYSPGATVSYFIAHIWGAAGGSGYNYSAGGGGGRSPNTGGPGGYTTGKVTVTGSPSYIMSVGQGGFANDNQNNYSGSSAFNGGGRGYCGTHYGVGGGGGGYSGIFLTSKTHGNSVMIAGGGAGAQSINHGSAPFYAGSGGGTTGQDGGQNAHSSHGGNTNGKGGTQSAGGAIGSGDYGTDTAGSALQGGNGAHMCGGGGGGYYGGGGADHKNNYGSSGSGGGSGYIGHASVSDASTSRTDMTTHAPSTIDPPGTGVSGYTGNAGRGISASNGSNGLIVIIPYTDSVSATGTAISKANTVTGARTKVSGVLLYKNAAGTNTLGTDLKVYFTCNGGSNWTEVGASDFSVGSDFSTGVKTVYLAEKTCTSGTDVRYKIEFANQSGSKKAEVYGMAINY